MIKAITKKQKRVFDLYQDYIKNKGYSPSYQEAGEKLGINKSAVYRHIKTLESLGYVTTSPLDRSVQLMSDEKTLPILGEIACGNPINIYEEAGIEIQVPESILKGAGSFYALRAKGRSMIGAGITEGDILVIRKQEDVLDGDIGVVVMGEDQYDEKVTLKRIFHTPKALMLRAENDDFPTQIIKSGEIRGKLVGVIRRYE